MASTDDVVLRLVIRGMDPVEVKRLADQTYGQLKTEAAQHIDRLAALHRAKTQEMTDEVRKYNEEAIKSTAKALSTVQQLMRQQEVVANQVSHAWRRTLEDLENFTVVATGAWNIMSSGFDRLKAASEEIINTTNIYNSLKGSIDEMRVATQGSVADIELIAAKNRALEKDLELTDEQFGLVAGQADRFADAIGVNGKEALDKLIDALATGQTKALKMAGVMPDLAAAQQKYADKIGTTVEALTEQEKLEALRSGALERMREKMGDVGSTSDTLADRMERGFVRIKNAITDATAALGNLDLSRFTDPEKSLSAEMYAQLPAVKARQDAATKALHDRLAAEYDNEQAASLDSSQEGNSPFLSPITNLSQADIEARSKMKRGDAKGARAAAEAAKRRIDFDAIQMRSTMEGNRDDALNPGNPDDILEGLAGAAANDNGGGGQKIEDWIQRGEEIQKMLDSSNAQAMEISAKATEAIIAKQQQYHDQMKEQAGFGGLALLAIFGADGPDGFYRHLTTFEQSMLDMSGMLSDVSKKAVEATGKSLAAAIAGANGHRQSIKQITHDMLMGLSEQAIVRALFETAMGIGDLAILNFPGAAAHFASAAAFGAVGAAAGLGARAVGDPSAPLSREQQWQKQHDDASAKKAYGDAHGWNDKPGMASSSSSSFGSGGQRSSGGSGGGDAPSIVINMSGVISTADAGREVKRALQEYENLTGEVVLARAA